MMIARGLQRRFGAARRPDWAAVLPAACAIHCTLTPLAASVLPLFAHSERLEWGLFWAAVVLAGASLRLTWASHRRLAVPALILIGLGIWVASLLGLLEPASHALTNALGGFVLAGALFWNGRLRHEAACGECGCGMHPRS